MEKDAFYVVRKGDTVGVYESFSDCQAQLGSSFFFCLFQVCEPSVSVFKGYGLPKKAEEYLVSHGLKNAAYSISAADVQNVLFGKLIPCSVQEPTSSGGKASDKDLLLRKREESDKSAEIIGSTSITMNRPKKHLKTDTFVEPEVFSSGCSSCILEFDGASKGNPGPAGAGVVLRANDGSTVWLFREGVGIATNNVAEYRAVILGLKHALRKGFKHIHVQGDSNLVCMQVQGLWKIKNQNLAGLCKEAKELKDKFISFEIKHVLREFNSDADAQANQAIHLRDGQVEEDCMKQ